MTDLLRCWEGDIELLFWVLAMGACVKDDGEGMRDWFVVQLRRVMRTFVPRPGLGRCKWILARFLWVERLGEKAFEDVFWEIEREGSGEVRGD